MLEVNPGVDDESHGAPQVVTELAILRIRIAVEAEALPESLGVESPPFRKGRIARVAPKGGQVVQLFAQRDLQVMTGHGLVRGEHFHFITRADLRSIEIDVEVAGA